MAKSRIAFTGSLYQLRSSSEVNVGAYVAVNGPHDTFGTVQKSEVQPDGSFLNLIRGSRAQVGVKPSVSF